ncbi:hypothetical protein GCM10010260_60300 [Streptomyces filipinensis]|uniref:Uncharacterized protein n=1 Tax=Streptomyces filipinensis TaxID=66887 RepID=A0A918IHE0_9ACTN|nr:hypothetical protein [Streptomyces filipinensis]GGV13246.1 hypothetical protein GCM10010260_60300 [Streptomyces filipinensis]
MDPSMLPDGELDLLEFLYEESQRPLGPEHPVKHDCFHCQLEAKVRAQTPAPPEGNPVPLERIPGELVESVEPLAAKNLAAMTTIRADRAVRLTESGQRVYREYLRQRQQARYEARLRGNPATVINIRDSHGFIAGSQRDFTQDNHGDF